MRVNESVIGFSRRSLSFFKALEMKAAPTRAVSASTTRRVALAATLVGLAVVLSPIYFPAGDTKCFPAQHMVNAMGLSRSQGPSRKKGSHNGEIFRADPMSRLWWPTDYEAHRRP